MRDLAQTATTDWLSLWDEEQQRVVKVNLSFLASNWNCLFGKGCPGFITKDSKKTAPDIGCCCVDDRTEALTQRGWVDGLSLRKSDIILALDPKDQKLKWSKIKSVYREQYNGKMHRLTGIGFDALVTPYHRFAVENTHTYDPVALVPVEQLRSDHRVILSGEAVEQPSVYSDAFVELMGWSVTEANYRSYQRKRDGGVTRWVRIYQRSDKSECDSIRAALKNTGADYHEGVSRNCSVFSIKGSVADLIQALSANRVLSQDFLLALSSYQQHLLIDTMILADGHFSYSDDGYQHRTYAQKDRAHVDSFVALCMMAGIRTTTRLRKLPDRVINGVKVASSDCWYVSLIKGKGTSIQYSVDFHGGRKFSYGRTKLENVPMVHYEGVVWCPETEYGTFVCRRNDSVYVTGNSTGFWTNDEAEVDRIDADIHKLTDEDWDTQLHDEWQKTGKWAVRTKQKTPAIENWYTAEELQKLSIEQLRELGQTLHIEDAEDYDANGLITLIVDHGAQQDGASSSRVIDGACIFANRSGGSTGKVGCAWLHYGNRIRGGDKAIDNNSEEHADFMPTVCSRLPLYAYMDSDNAWVITVWSINRWSEGDVTPGYTDDSNESNYVWWCVAEGTMVATSDGEKPIESVSEKDRVLTRAGFRQVLRRWDNGERATVEIVYEGGSLFVTEDHKLLTNQGWLTAREIITLAADTMASARSDVSIFRSELVSLGAMAGVTSERLATHNVHAVRNTIKVSDVDTDLVSAQMVKFPTTFDESIHRLPDVGSSVSGSAVSFDHSVTLASIVPPRNALIGVNNVVRDIENAHGDSDNNTVARNTSLGSTIDGGAAVDTGFDIHSRTIHHIREAGYRRVFDLTVEDQHEYVANGIVVHNCCDSGDSYTSKSMVVDSMRKELLQILSDEHYQTVRNTIHERQAAKVSINPMQAQHTQLPIVQKQSVKNSIGNRKPVREWEGFEE